MGPAAGAGLGAHRAFLSLGANLGRRGSQLARAISLLGGRGIVPCAWSSIYESTPLGPWPDQPLFFNAVIAVRTQLSAEGLLQAMLAIERSMGRRRLRAQGPRLIDLDLLLYDDAVRWGTAPILPHPRLHQRAFALRPLLELEADLHDPRDGLPLARHLAALADQRLVRRGQLFLPSRPRCGRAAATPKRSRAPLSR
ncbi:MAG: 2-amino-4-hydroxy-6-hydroxymethyldihydropteridine diphosphokinase [Proteobacteria bacterium]|nr:2-amino-4-hydroxy-6-hydroxymethyldihydropteridine diphosphokinase [Pseudomonadota bacterium]